jgi:subtilase family serine protease
MPAGSFASATKSITIPSSLAPGTYYVGYLVDPYNSVAESDESNNQVALLSSITVK